MSLAELILILLTLLGNASAFCWVHLRLELAVRKAVLRGVDNFLSRTQRLDALEAARVPKPKPVDPLKPAPKPRSKSWSEIRDTAERKSGEPVSVN
jgi:hypothetical protein